MRTAHAAWLVGLCWTAGCGSSPAGDSAGEGESKGARVSQDASTPSRRDEAMSWTLTREPDRLELVARGPLVIAADAHQALVASGRFALIVLRVETSSTPLPSASEALATAMEAGLLLERGTVTLEDGELNASGTVRTRPELEAFSNLVGQVRGAFGGGGTTDVTIDPWSLRPGEGLIRHRAGMAQPSEWVGTVSGERVRPDSEGRVPPGLYRVGDSDLSIAVAEGRVTWLRDDARSILIAGRRFALDDDVAVRLPGEEGALGFASQVDEAGAFVSAAKGGNGRPISGQRRTRLGDLVTGDMLLRDRSLIRRVVLHTDVAADAAAGVANDKRAGVSHHFAIDWDGTIHQLLDVAIEARHAGDADGDSVGIVLNNLLPNLEREPDASWLPAKHPRLPEMSTPEAARRVSDRMAINGVRVQSYGYTDAQYRSLGTLLRTLGRVFPAIGKGAPRDARGEVIGQVIVDVPAPEGVLAHWHVAADRWDPGPGLDWNRLGLDDAPVR